VNHVIMGKPLVVWIIIILTVLGVIFYTIGKK